MVATNSTLESDPKRLFDLWYRRPLLTLEQLPDGDGGFAALAISCFLYERYAKAVLREAGRRGDRSNVLDQLASDFTISAETAGVFWDVIRDGFLHHAMPKAKDRGKKLPNWRSQHSFPQAIELVRDPKPGELRIQVWHFRDRVLELYEARPDLIACDDNFPWGKIVENVEVNEPEA